MLLASTLTTIHRSIYPIDFWSFCMLSILITNMKYRKQFISTVCWRRERRWKNGREYVCTRSHLSVTPSKSTSTKLSTTTTTTMANSKPSMWWRVALFKASSLPMQMNMRITVETNKNEWRDPVVSYRCDVINICSLYCPHCYHHFPFSYLIPMWFARFIGFSRGKSVYANVLCVHLVLASFRFVGPKRTTTPNSSQAQAQAHTYLFNSIDIIRI